MKHKMFQKFVIFSKNPMNLFANFASWYRLDNTFTSLNPKTQKLALTLDICTKTHVSETYYR